MSTGMRLIPMKSSSGAALQNPENRSTDPTPLKDPSGMVPDSTTYRARLGSTNLKDVLFLSGASGLTYAGANYGYHKLNPKSKDPNAIKAFTAGKLLKGGLMQMGSSAAAYYTSDMIGQYVPSVVNPGMIRPVLTGTYKTGLTMALKKKPTMGAAITDFIISAGSDYVGPAIVYMGYAVTHDALTGKLHK